MRYGVDHRKMAVPPHTAISYHQILESVTFLRPKVILCIYHQEILVKVNDRHLRFQV